MKRIPYNYTYYNRSLLYVSGEDSILYEVSDTYISNGHKLGGLSVDCSPEMNINRRGKKMSIDHSFSYSLNEGDDPKVTLFLYFNFSSIKVPLDSLVKLKDQEIEFTKFEYYGNEKNQFIRRAKFKNMFFTEVEEYSGKIWRLAKVGDSIVQ